MLIKLRERSAQSLRAKASGEAGFTLVELLVVMLILGLLAAIAIPSFFNQRDKAKDADAKESVRTAQTATETYATDNDGSYSGATSAILVGIESTLADAPGTLTVTPNGAGTGYTVSVASETTNVFSITRNADGTVDYTCTAAGTAGCPGSGGGTGNWG
jgi:type II secretion system protein G